MHASKYRSAEADLEWLFTAGGAAMGLHAQAYDATGDHAAWTEDRVQRLHDSKRTQQHREGIVRHASIVARFESMTSRAQQLAIAAYTPRQWPAALRAAVAKAGEHASLIGVVLLMPETIALYTEGHGHGPAGGAELLGWLTVQAERTRGDKTASAKVFRPINAGARRVLEVECLDAYVEATKVWKRAMLARFLEAAE